MRRNIFVYLALFYKYFDQEYSAYTPELLSVRNLISIELIQRSKSVNYNPNLI